MPPTHHLHQLGPQAQMMAKDCGNERLALTLQYVALGSMIVMTGCAAAHLLREVFAHHAPQRRRSRSR